ncbi:MAG: hypothetical protein A3H97_03260 [Acidobacteria bacterium RIFCSPLOWO2_02_FULL_65_29]|nr:MAG: hypothetical protein A3H97_03260 [Acidobacteria bacterium RIFCSPLOWO2_02_FULL_65_29]
MNLANPAALWLLPLLLLLLLPRGRRPQARQHVATLHLWRAAARDLVAAAPRRLRRDWLAVFMQSAFLLLLIGSLARPTLSTRGSRVTVIVDLSASMGARHGGATRLDTAKDRIAGLVATLPRRTRVRLIGAHAVAELVGEFTASDPALERALRELRVSDAAGAIATVVEDTRALQPAAIYVVSDMPRPATGSASAPGVDWTVVGDAADNVAIATLSLGDPLSIGQVVEVLLSVRNYGSEAVTTTVTIEQKGAVVRREPVTVASRSVAALVTTIENLPGIVTARLDVNDALAADNTRAVVVPGSGPIRVRLIAASYFVERALSVHPGVSVVPAARLDGTAKGPVEEADVVVCDGCATLPPGEASVLIFPPRPSRPAEPVSLTMTGEEHPLRELPSLDGLAAVSVPSEGPFGEGVVVARAGGIPAVVAHTSGVRRVVEVRLDPTVPGFALTPAFPMLVASAVEWLAARDRNATTVVAGVPLRWAMAATSVSSIPSSTPAVVGPDGRPVPATFAAGVLSVVSTRAAGIYRLRTDSSEQAFVVNPATDGESDLLQKTTNDSAAHGAPEADLRERELTPFLLLAALAVLAAESQRRYESVRAARSH